MVEAWSGNSAFRSLPMMSPMRMELETLNQKYGAVVPSGASGSRPQVAFETGASASATPGASSDQGSAASMSTIRMLALRANRYRGSAGSAFVIVITAAAALNFGVNASARREM